MHNPAVTLPAELPDCTHVWHIFAVRCADRHALEKMAGRVLLAEDFAARLFEMCIRDRGCAHRRP